MSCSDIQRLAYQNLVQAASAFSLTESAQGFKEFMDFARLHYCPATATKDAGAEVMEWLSSANRQADWVPLDLLVQNWIPYAYHARTHEISWCLPQGRAVQPFYDEYISHCRQHLVNAFLTPQSSIKSLLLYAEQLPELPDPSGFIFHLSRCGSTLVSGCLAQLECCSVLSESPLLTDILLAQNIAMEDKKSLLRLCLHLQGRSSPEQPHVNVKWNAWDIFYWDVIREIWPKVPVLLLTRDPVEVIASHVRSSGRHMSGDPALAHIDLALQSANDQSLLAYRIQVLRVLMNKMRQVQAQPNVRLLDYTSLNEDAIRGVCQSFGVTLDGTSSTIFGDRLTCYSKQPDKTFQEDGQDKRAMLSNESVWQINQVLAGLYEEVTCSEIS